MITGTCRCIDHAETPASRSASVCDLPPPALPISGTASHNTQRPSTIQQDSPPWVSPRIAEWCSTKYLEFQLAPQGRTTPCAGAFPSLAPKSAFSGLTLSDWPLSDWPRSEWSIESLKPDPVRAASLRRTFPKWRLLQVNWRLLLLTHSTFRSMLGSR